MGATTLRMPDELHERLNAWAREEGRSFNELAVGVLERELRRHERARALAGIIEFSRHMGEKYGVLPGDAVEDLRQMREERTERV